MGKGAIKITSAACAFTAPVFREKKRFTEKKGAGLQVWRAPVPGAVRRVSCGR